MSVSINVFKEILLSFLRASLNVNLCVEIVCVVCVAGVYTTEISFFFFLIQWNESLLDQTAGKPETMKHIDILSLEKDTILDLGNIM